MDKKDLSNYLILLHSKLLLNTLSSNILGPCPSLNIGDQVSHPYRITGKIIGLYILIFKFFDSIREDRRFCIEW
jgi:hypothetical protein